eukprot:TRINITY_DN418_c0_g1_i2.p1 TRINITY_DN418_c0_g1~~TRINITY_DN418_c0_g1_i2.p1  ORF type:complete len:677 (+),score=310.54 TRINITY_DN418_c0_g1_i2:212-2242(+)
MEARLKEVKEITQRVMTQFTKFYLQSLKEVMIEDIKARRYKVAKQAIVDAKNAGKPEKPRRPREKKAKPGRLSAKVSYSYELDSGIDPYIVYAITAELGKEKVTTYKRYKLFKKFHDKYGKKVKAAKLPPPSSTWGSRDLSWEFRRSRETSLQEYVDAICADEKSATHKDVLNFFRLGLNEDPVFVETFKRAYRRTRSYLWQWSWVVYDTEEEAIGRLVAEEVKYRMWSDICSTMPPNATVRRKAMQVAWKSIQATITPAVAAGWKVVKETVDKVKPAISSALETALTPMVQLQAEIQIKVNDALAAGFAPIVDGVKGLVGPLAAAVIPEIEKAVSAAAPFEKFTEYFRDFESVIVAEDVEKMKEMQKEVADIRANVIKAVDEQLEKAMEPVLGDFKAKVSIEALMSIFGPVARLNSISKSFFEFIDPGTQFHVVEEMIKWKKQIKENGKDKVEEYLDREEWDIDYWEVWRVNSKISWSGWSAAWNLYRLLPDAYTAVSVFEEFVRDFARLNKIAFKKKFSYKFGDYLHEAAKTCTTPEEFNAAVDQSFLIGYQRCVKYFNKHFMRIVVKNVKKALRALFVDKITKLLLEGASMVIDPLASMIVSPLDNLIEIGSIVDNAIKENMDNLLDETISSIHPSFAKAIGEIRALEPTEKQIWEVVMPPPGEETKKKEHNP